MRSYKITEEMRNSINDFLGQEYLKPTDLGRNIYRLDNYDKIANVEPEKAHVLMATLFPEEVVDPGFLFSHKNEIKGLAGKLHIEKELSEPHYTWTHYMVRMESAPVTGTGFRDEDIFKGNIIRFR